MSSLTGTAIMQRLVLFDMMDTLVSEPYFRLIERLVPDPEQRRAYFGWRDREAHIEFERGEISEAELFRRFYLPDLPASLREVYPSPERVKKGLLRELSYMPGIRELLAWLAEQSDVRIGIASNYSCWYVEFLARLPLLSKYADYLFFSCEMNARKPEPRFYEMIETAIAESAGPIAPHSILFIDDREANLEPARARGWNVHLMQSAGPLRTAIEAFLKAPP
ncbi:MAG: HAD hydrolase-like protein [Spirochaetales bacterium]|nr:HAD hydrolase-like protein [Spirochaetales bacterium]